MVVRAVGGALGFLTRLPVGHDETAWEAFRRTPLAFPLAGYLIGGLLALPFLLPLPDPTLALVFVAWVYLLTGINHLDGVADVGDALAVHGDAERRRAVLKDTTLGVGGIAATMVIILGVGLAALGLVTAIMEVRYVVGIVVAAEVSAKLAMATIICGGEAIHDGMGAQFVTESNARSLRLPLLVAAPALLLTVPHFAAAMSVLGGLAAGVASWQIAERTLGGVNGDVIGATNEVARVVALHLGVIAWMLL